MFISIIIALALASFFFFFFEAEDGIRDTSVAGVQTWALPILRALGRGGPTGALAGHSRGDPRPDARPGRAGGLGKGGWAVRVARILLGVCGGIAAYKAVELARLAIGAGHSVRVVQTESAERFVGRATFEGITGAPALVSEWERDPARGAYPGEPAPEDAPISI